MKRLLVNKQQYLRLPSPARGDLDAISKQSRSRGAGQHQVLPDDKSFYQLASADKITELGGWLAAGSKFVSRIGQMVM
ncbi:hypothetical protein [Aeromonas allosaccharophila]|uniref:hypothetical protein n=1 Tax=Aeromonas allosaccharophila TaxID=656 RepID=UPI001F23C290|nr:hypothetical protein [Aeromonas allosaccharophila]MCE9953225.1 hypothetical protein [Aeromonas allosaccharophila]